MIPSALRNVPTAPGDACGGARADKDPSLRLLVQSLIDAAVIDPDEWGSLGQQARDQLLALADKDALLDQLTQLTLINTYQAKEIAAGNSHQLVFGNYRVLGRLGSGGSGVVFEAEHILMRRKVALKVLPVNSAEQSARTTRFLREMRAIARLEHPNIVAAFDAGVCRDGAVEHLELYYFAMEHLTGSDLEKLVREQVPTISTACELIYQIASALDEAHRHSLVHRDIKPSNIFVTDEHQAKLLDFGLVRSLFSDGCTTPGCVVGTLDFMAPEQAFDPTLVDIRTDIFGLGATLFFTLTGTTPFPTRESLLKALQIRREQRPPSARSMRPEVPAALENVLQRMMAIEPNDRYPTPQAVMRALLPFLDSPNPCDTAYSDNPAFADHPSALGSGLSTKAHRTLVVDPDPDVRYQFVRLLTANDIDCHEAADGAAALDALRGDAPSAVLLSVNLPDIDGRAILKALRDNPPCPNLKIIMTSYRPSADEMSSLLAAGADDYLALPRSSVQMAARVKSALKHKEAQDRTDQLSRQLLEMNAELERSLSARTTDFVQARNALVLAVARLVEYRSIETIAHLTRMQRYCTILAEEASSIASFAGQIDAEFIQTIECCAPLHDIGNVGLPDQILLKSSRLDDNELRIMQTHTVIGADTLQHVARRFSAGAGFLRMAIDIARHHHEHFDGTGYPDRLSGNDIPLAARLLSIADAYDALRSRRAQRPGLSHSSTLQIMLESSAGKYDPLLLSAFHRCGAQFDRIFRELPDSLNFD